MGAPGESRLRGQDCRIRAGSQQGKKTHLLKGTVWCPNEKTKIQCAKPRQFERVFDTFSVLE